MKTLQVPCLGLVLTIVVSAALTPHARAQSDRWLTLDNDGSVFARFPKDGAYEGTIGAVNSLSYPIMVSPNADGSGALKIGNPTSVLSTSNSVKVGLWVGPNGSTDWSQLTLKATVLAPIGTSPGAQGQFRFGNPLILAGYYLGDTVAYGYQAWSELTIDDPIVTPPDTGYYGNSGIAQNYILAGGPNPPMQTFGTAGLAHGQVTGFTMTPVIAIPEPGSCLLTSLGFVLWLSTRRRR